MQHSISAIFFDMDGTLTDLNVRWLKPVDEALSKIKPDYNKNAIGENITKIITQVGGKNNLLIVKVLWSIGRFAGFKISDCQIFICY